MNVSTRSGATTAACCKVIIVDDNYAVADGLKWALEAEGHEIVGMAATNASAIELIEHKACDVVILDVDLRGESSNPVARLLIERAIPFLFITGFGDVVSLPADLAHVPRLEKPANPDEIIALIAQLERGAE